jgi:hypothetical protein
MASWDVLALRAALIVPVAIAAGRHDVIKFRGWRERCRRWQRENKTPPPEYERDNRLWRWRLGALAMCAGALLGLAVALFSPHVRPWLIWPLYGMSMLGAITWSVMSEHVR